ncbi:MAG TPA: hypothetical protein VHA74_00285 [Candidatus Dojkabacteria bacterium]|nr:hypothetical protein [Candidatus Dojkabacteria bacterium]
MTKKNKNSVFDMFFITSTLMILWGRVMYIVLNLNDYVGLPWSISPYERYTDGVFFFRLLPWRYFALWDGGVLYIPMFVVFVVIATLYALAVKRWRIREILGTIIIPSTFLLSTTFLATGLYSNDITIFTQGLYMVLFVFFYQALQFILSIIWRNKMDLFFKTYFFISIFANAFITIYLSINLLNSPITSIDRWHMYIFIIWSIIITILFVIDMNKSTHVKEIHIKSKKITPNVPIRIHNTEK